MLAIYSNQHQLLLMKLINYYLIQAVARKKLLIKHYQVICLKKYVNHLIKKYNHLEHLQICM